MQIKWVGRSTTEVIIEIVHNHCCHCHLSGNRGSGWKSKTWNHLWLQTHPAAQSAPAWKHWAKRNQSLVFGSWRGRWYGAFLTGTDAASKGSLFHNLKSKQTKLCWVYTKDIFPLSAVLTYIFRPLLVQYSCVRGLVTGHCICSFGGHGVWGSWGNVLLVHIPLG